MTVPIYINLPEKCLRRKQARQLFDFPQITDAAVSVDGRLVTTKSKVFMEEMVQILIERDAASVGFKELSDINMFFIEKSMDHFGWIETTPSGKGPVVASYAPKSVEGSSRSLSNKIMIVLVMILYIIAICLALLWGPWGPTLVVGGFWIGWILSKYAREHG